MDLQLADNVKARQMAADGRYHIPRRAPGVVACDSQNEFIAQALEQSRGGRRSRKPKTRYPAVQLAPRPNPRKSA